MIIVLSSKSGIKGANGAAVSDLVNANAPCINRLSFVVQSDYVPSDFPTLHSVSRSILSEDAPISTPLIDRVYTNVLSETVNIDNVLILRVYNSTLTNEQNYSPLTLNRLSATSGVNEQNYSPYTVNKVYLTTGINEQNYSPYMVNKVYLTTAASEQNYSSYFSVNPNFSITGNRGFIAGGWDGTVNTADIEGINFDSVSSTNTAASLVSARRAVAGVQSTTKGYFAGGYDGTGYYNEIDAIKFSNETAVDPSVALAVARSNLSSASSSTKGYWFGGLTGSVSAEIDGITFATEASYNPSVSVAVPLYDMSVIHNDLVAVFAGGQTPASSSCSDYTFSTDTSSTVAYSLSVARYNSVGLRAISTGYFVYGYTGSAYSTISDKFNFVEQTMTAKSFTLSVTRAGGAATGTGTIGYIGGGTTTGSRSAVYDTLTYATETIGTPSFTMSTARNGAGAVTTAVFDYSGVVYSYSDRGYTIGGFNSSSVAQSSVEGVKYVDDTTVSPTATLSLARAFGFGNGSSTKGYYIGGETQENISGTVSNKIDAFTYTNQSCAAISATLTASKKSGASFSSITKGYQFGGINNSQVNTNTVYSLTFSNETTSALSATLTTATSLQASLNNYDVGYAAGGSTGSNINTIAGFTFFTETISAPSATLSATVRNIGAANTSFYGYSVGGIVTSTNVNTVNKFDFLALTNSTSSATMSTALRSLACHYSTTKGYFAGGWTGTTGSNVMQYMTFATEVFANQGTSLAVEKYQALGLTPYFTPAALGINPSTISTDKGFVVGGWAVSSTSAMDVFNYSTEVNTLSTKSLSTAKYASAPTSNYVNGYINGGATGSTNAIDSIEKLSLSSGISSAISSVLGAQRRNAAGVQSTTNSYVAGGYSSSAAVGTIYSLAYSSDAVTTLSAVLSSVRGRGWGASDVSKGFFIAGSGYAGALRNDIDKITFATDTIATTTITLSVGRYAFTGLQSVDQVFMLGGTTNDTSSLTEIDGLTFATETATNSSSVLTTGIHSAAGLSYSTKGYIFGGTPNDSTYVSVVSSFNYVAQTNNAIASTLGFARSYGCGISIPVQNIANSGYADTLSRYYAYTTGAWTTQLYVDPVLGSDTVGTGDRNSPFASIVKAVSSAGSATTIWLRSGNHTLTSVTGSDSGALYDGGKQVAFIGLPEYTIINSSSSTRDVHAVGLTNANSTANSIIFKMDTGTRTTNYTVAFISYLGTAKMQGTINNCVFYSYRSAGGASYASMFYNNGNTNAITINNCSFYSDYMLQSYTGCTANDHINDTLFYHPSNSATAFLTGNTAGGGAAATLSNVTQNDTTFNTTTYHSSFDGSKGFFSGVYSGTITNRGYVFGSADYAGGNYSSEIDGINFTNDSSVNPAATLSVAKGWTTGLAVNTNGYICGGSLAAGTLQTTIEKYNYLYESIATSGTALSGAIGYAANRGGSNGYKGYIFGGYNGTALVNSIKGFTYLTEAVGDPSATLTNATHRNAVVYSNTAAYPAGGAGSSIFGNIDRFTYSVESRITTVVGLATTLYDFGAMSSANRGYYTGGDTGGGSNSNNIRVLDYSSETVYNSGTSLTQVRKNAPDLATAANGYMCGGDSGVNPTKTYSNTIDKFVFATETKTVPSAVLVSARTSGCGLYSDAINYSDVNTKVLAHFDGA